MDSANARKRRRLTLNPSSDGPFADIAGADDTAAIVEDDYDSDSDGSEFEFESADNSPLRSHPGDGFVQFVTSAFQGTTRTPRARLSRIPSELVPRDVSRVSKQVSEVVVLRRPGETRGRYR